MGCGGSGRRGGVGGGLGLGLSVRPSVRPSLRPSSIHVGITTVVFGQKWGRSRSLSQPC